GFAPAFRHHNRLGRGSRCRLVWRSLQSTRTTRRSAPSRRAAGLSILTDSNASGRRSRGLLQPRVETTVNRWLTLGRVPAWLQSNAGCPTIEPATCPADISSCGGGGERPV